MTEREFPFDPEPSEPEVMMIDGKLYEIIGEAVDGSLVIMPAALARPPIPASRDDQHGTARKRKRARHNSGTKINGTGEP